MSTEIIEIKPISAAETLPIRHQVMWPNKPMSYVKLPNDENGRHFGLFAKEKLTTVVSLFVTDNEAQFRKFATLHEFQGLGYGTKLLEHIVALAHKEGIHKLWCNARVEKSKFYERFHLKPTSKTFEKDGVYYIIMEKNTANS